MKTRVIHDLQQHDRWRQVVRAHKRGRSRTQIAEEVGLSYNVVSKTITSYEALGATGEDRALTEEQEQTIQRLICDKRPEQLKMEFELWGRAAAMQLIDCEYGVLLRGAKRATLIPKTRNVVQIWGIRLGFTEPTNAMKHNRL